MKIEGPFTNEQLALILAIGSSNHINAKQELEANKMYEWLESKKIKPIRPATKRYICA